MIQNTVDVRQTSLSRIFGLLASLLDANQDGMISGEEVARAQEMALARGRRGEPQ